MFMMTPMGTSQVIVYDPDVYFDELLLLLKVAGAKAETLSDADLKQAVNDCLGILAYLGDERAHNLVVR